MATNDNTALLLQVSADTSKAEKRLDAFINKLNGVDKKVSAAGAKSQTALDKFFGKPGQALDKVFDSTRFRIFDTGAARIGLFGSSLEKLGVIGLGTAAAIGAVAFALNQAGEAIKFTDELEDTAHRLHITTDALQEYRYAVRALGGDEKGADEALEAFSSTLGKAQAGLPKAIKGFKELGFTDAQIKGFTDVESTLTAVNEKISKLKSPAQKDAVVEQLGLTGIKEAVEGLPEDFAKARAEAHKVGVVMDAELIAKASGLSDQLQTINERISVDMKSAFVSLGPVLLQFKAGLAGLLEDVLALIDGFRRLQNRSRITLEGQLQGATDRNAELTAQYGTRIPMSKVSQFRNNQRIIAENSGQLAQLNNQEELRKQGENAKAFWERKAGGTSLIPQTKSSGPSAQSQQKHFDDELARIAEQILAASDDDLHTLQERQAIARKRLALEEDAKETSIKDQVATKAITAKQGEILLGKQKEAGEAKQTQLLALQHRALLELQIRNEQAVAGAMADYLGAELGIAGTAEERGQLEAEILSVQRATARAVLAQQLDAENASPFQKALELGLFDRTSEALNTKRDIRERQAVSADQLTVSHAALQAQIDAAQLQSQLAETAKARRDAELKILDLQYQQQRAQLEAVIATSENVADIKKARIERDALDANHAGQVAAVKQGTRGPLEQFNADLAIGADKLNERLEKVKVQGLQGLEDGLVGVITHTEKLGDVFRNVANQIIADLARISIEQAIIGPLTRGLSSPGGLFSGLGSLFGGHRATGGPVVPGKIYEVNERGREFFAPSVAGTIIPHSAIRAASDMHGGSQQITVISPVHVHAEGAVGFKEMVAAINQQIDASHQGAVKTAVSIASRSFQGRAQQASRLGT